MALEVVLTLLFDALLLVFMLKLLLAIFHTKLIVILLYIAVLLFAMALSGRFPEYIIDTTRRLVVSSDGNLLDALAAAIKVTDVGEHHVVDATSKK
ncbi:hypothetical protein ACP4OV_022697 [Aristida adscensionis]